MGRNINMGRPPTFNTGGSNAEGFTPGRGLSVGEIMSRREGRSNAHYADGTPVKPGTVLSMPGWSTSGVGPGTRGYRGSGGTQGYSFQNQGTAETKRADYSPSFGGLNEFYRQQQGMSDWDRLQGEAAMDMEDAEGSRMAQLSRVAAQRGDYDTAAQFADALNERAAQRLAMQGGAGSPQAMGGDPWAGRTSYGDVGSGFSSTPQLDPNSTQVQTMLDQAALNSRTPISRYGTGSVTQGGNVGPFGTQSSFTNAQGSAGPGGTRTSYGGVQSGPEFFQQSANRQRTGNAFAQPQSGFNGRPADDLDSYANRLLQAKQRLGKA